MSRTGASLTVLRAERPPALALAGPEGAGGRLGVRVLRAAPNGRDTGLVRALDAKGLPLAEAAYAFAPDATETEVGFDLPVEIRNGIARIEVAGEHSAAAVVLADERGRRRRVGLVFGGTSDQAQPLLSPVYYLSRALSPFADVQEPRGGRGVAEAINQMLDAQVSVLMLADVGALDPAAQERVAAFVQKGGMLVRFAGPRLAAGSDDLVPVRLRRGGRVLGGTLSWDSPRTLAPFAAESPFSGLKPPADIGVRRQILAEPDGELARRTWAALQDGTPIVTAAKRGEGLVVLFHVTADTNWSNLPLSGLFVDMLRRTLALAGTGPAGAAPGGGPPPVLAPRLALDGTGAFVAPPATARAVPATYTERATAEHPPGFYGPVDGGLAVNALRPDDRLRPLDVSALAGARFAGLEQAGMRDLRGGFFLAALALLVLDTLASLWLGGFLGLALARLRRPAAALILAGLALAAAGPEAARAQAPAANRPNGIESALATRLAYVVTGDAAVDDTSRAGLTGLTQMLASRTALEPGEPAGIDPAKDELAFYPLIYWPVVAGRPQPGEAAIRRIDAFMRNGGTVIFDTRDAMTARPGGPPTPEALALQRMLATLEVPELEPVPRDHVLTKAFYLVETFRAATPTARPGSRPCRRPATAPSAAPLGPATASRRSSSRATTSPRPGPSVAAARRCFPSSAAIRASARWRSAAGQHDDVRPDGNYKADQVHVPALLERLGQ